MNEEHRINIMSDEQPAQQEAAETEETPQVAGIAERFVALLIDWGLISILYQLLLVAWIRATYPDLEQIYWALAGVFIPFVLYEAIWSCGGRSTLGKKLVGIRVADKNTGEPLGFGRALLRGVGYLISAALLMCGFLLAFIDDQHRALQDYLAGSVVVQARNKSRLEKLLLTVTGLVLIAAFTGYFYSLLFGAGSFAQQQLISRAQNHLEKIGYLEEVHKRHFGYYTNDLLRLSILSGDPVQFQRDTQKVLDRRDFRIGVTDRGYKIKAHAKDKNKTAVYYPSL